MIDALKANFDTRGRCDDHNFLRFLQIFGEKIGVFSKTNVMIKIFAQFSFVMSQKRQFFRSFFGENILKIITSVPVPIILAAL
jgi:hypothetical protein